VNIAVLGAGAREHALQWRLARDGHSVRVYPGSAAIPGSTKLHWSDVPTLTAALTAANTRLVVVGPEQPLAEGLADDLRRSGFSVLGPNKSAAALETSKAYAKSFMNKYGVPTAHHATYSSIREAATQTASNMRGGNASGCVIKLDGLAAGKGVFVCPSSEEACAVLAQLQTTHADNTVLVIEELLVGREVSLLAILDGKQAKLFPSAQDHKRLLDGDRGPNTGGMGAYCPVPWCSSALIDDIYAQIVEPTVNGLAADGEDYRGILYFGVMVTADGPKLLEYNARFGDPEAQAILPQLNTDVGELFLQAATGTFPAGARQVDSREGYSVCVVAATSEYPTASSSAAQVIVDRGLTHPSSTTAPQTEVFHAATTFDGTQWHTSGGRVLSAVGSAASFDDARTAAYSRLAQITFEGMQFRRDIGNQGRAKRIAILFSGAGTNMLALLESMRAGLLHGLAEPCFLLSNRSEAGGVTAARGFDVELLPSKGVGATEYDHLLGQRLAAAAPDYILLAGFMKMLGPTVVNQFARRILNIHPADTRVHQGLGGYEWAFQQKLPETAVTVHYVDVGMDTGEVLSLSRVDLNGAATLAEVEARGLAVEHECYARTLRNLLLRNGQ
jgi:phosphoribosylamine---glycine ligase